MTKKREISEQLRDQLRDAFDLVACIAADRQWHGRPNYQPAHRPRFPVDHAQRVRPPLQADRSASGRRVPGCLWEYVSRMKVERLGGR